MFIQKLIVCKDCEYKFGQSDDMVYKFCPKCDSPNIEVK